jgi:hypothetical protein
MKDNEVRIDVVSDAMGKILNIRMTHLPTGFVAEGKNRAEVQKELEIKVETDRKAEMKFKRL